MTLTCFALLVNLHLRLVGGDIRENQKYNVTDKRVTGKTRSEKTMYDAHSKIQVIPMWILASR